MTFRHTLALMTLCLAGLAPRVHAAAPSCETQAAEKKLAGAAKNSFLKKCAADAGVSAAAASAPAAPQAACEAQAAEKKLAGAAKASFVKKCVKDAA
jgi:hypothetical protein